MYPNNSYGLYGAFQTSELCRYPLRYLIFNALSYSSLFNNI
ncbi:hypothetical protein F383_35856 [Gossypium arboreum]|uniref:Uncharacterized protein n=1 Tax=Gossypium arboreum TaxID=29729 RepID=A0A0B0N7P1_GOSAR|nr:hypothetical protein F383_35856 [Gossypium arboreum]